jgi:hypothetical protein
VAFSLWLSGHSQICVLTLPGGVRNSQLILPVEDWPLLSVSLSAEEIEIAVCMSRPIQTTLKRLRISLDTDFSGRSFKQKEFEEYKEYEEFKETRGRAGKQPSGIAWCQNDQEICYRGKILLMLLLELLPPAYSRRAMISSYDVAENQRRQAAVAAEVSSTMVFGRAGSRSVGGFCRQLKQNVFPIRSKN